MRDLTCQHIQVDEIWTYVEEKQRCVTEQDDNHRVGDQWTFVALDADTKLIPIDLVGKRDLDTAKLFMSPRIANVWSGNQPYARFRCCASGCCSR